MLQVAILVYPGFDELDAVGPFEVLRAAELEGAAFRVRLVSRLAPELITASHGLVLRVENRLTTADRPDWLIVPGGGWRNRAELGTWGEVQRGDLPKLLSELWRAGTKMASVCTGAMLLGAAGILQGRRATTHHVAHADLAKYGAEHLNARVVDSEEVVTAAGVTSGLDLALWLVERFAGPTAAAAGAQRMEYERHATVTS